MKTKNLLYLLIFPGLFFGLTSWYSSGSPGGKTGSPGDGANCTQCHTGTPQSASGWITTNIPAMGYTPGQTYTITVTGTHSGVGKFGFETTAESSGGSKKGTFIITDAVQTQLTNSNHAVTHTSAGTTPSGNSKTWTFDWTAPAAGTGNITFYAAFNAANGNGNNQGDVIYLTSTSVSEEVVPETSLTISFSGMTPHVGQKLEIRLVNKYDLTEYARQKVDPIPAADFDVVFDPIVDGDSYFVDFYADFNGNGMYDLPPTDHAWRLDADNVSGGDVINFSHNTNFIDIDWKQMLTLNFDGMTPHIGQMLDISIRDITYTYEETFQYDLGAVPSASFSLDLPALRPGHSYNVDFYADLNGNGLYDAPPTDHAWRIKTGTVGGDTTIDFTHNTNFTDVGWAYRLTLDLNGMTPHVGQPISFRITDTDNGEEVSRFYRDVDLAAIAVSLPGLKPGKTYNVDFYADFNGNGIYDPPPTDHSWRMTTDPVTGNTDLSFTHNTNFTDVNWKYMVTLHAQEMNPHIGQLFELRVYDTVTLLQIGMVSIASLEVPDFYVMVPGSQIGESYNIDFFADFNGNGFYDPPPVDHAWRLNVEVEGDTIVPFTHNTNFTNIMWPVSVNENRIDDAKVMLYPNPFSNSFNISMNDIEQQLREVHIYSVEGRLIRSDRVEGNNTSYTVGTASLKTGLYHVIFIFDDNNRVAKTVIKR